MRTAAQHIVEKNVDVVVVLSPHTPRYRNAFGVAEGYKIEGTFEQFGRPDLCATFTSDTHIQKTLESIAAESGVSLKPIPSHQIDHGALVPLHFLKECEFQGNVIIIGFPAANSESDRKLLGEVIRKTAIASGKSWALVASGDMSHRLTPGAPAGFHPQAERFDRLVVKCVESGNYENATSIDSALRELAAEDVVESLDVAAAVLQGNSHGRKLLSYESPFGVGYLVAILANKE
jgi:aromatic ring-opening dioxygenase LigB subunit